MFTAVPDPYAIDDDDDDDLVLIDAGDLAATDPIATVEEPTAASQPPADTERSQRKDRLSRTKSKRASRGPDPVASSAEDPVIVDVPDRSSGPDNVIGADDSPYRDGRTSHRRPLESRQTTSNAKKSEGLMGFLGSLRKKERRPSDGERDRSGRDYDTEERALPIRRKRSGTGTGSGGDIDPSKRTHRDGTPRRSRRQSDSDAARNSGGAASASADDKAAEARRAERRAKRTAEREAEAAREKAAHDARKAKAREVRERRAREEQEAETRRQEEKRARRAARDAEAQEAIAKDAARKERRRERDRDREREAAAAALSGDGQKSAPVERERDRDRDRTHRRSRNAGPSGVAATDDDQARRIRHEERRASKRASMTPGAERPSHHRRRTSGGPITDYFDSRNGTGRRSRRASDHSNTDPERHLGRRRSAGEHNGRPYLVAGKDKTSSWVNSVNADPPEPPVLEGTVLDPAPRAERDRASGRASGAEGEEGGRRRSGEHTTSEEDAARRERRARRRSEREKDRGGEKRVRGGDKDRERERDKRATAMRSSDGSGGEKLSRRKSYAVGQGVTGGPPSPTGQDGRRASWLSRKIRGI